jgi:hypothetical protein
MPDPDASQSTMKGHVKSGNWRTWVKVDASLRELNADAATGVHRNASLFRSCVSGATILS